MISAFRTLFLQSNDQPTLGSVKSSPIQEQLVGSNACSKDDSAKGQRRSACDQDDAEAADAEAAIQEASCCRGHGTAAEVTVAMDLVDSSPESKECSSDACGCRVSNKKAQNPASEPSTAECVSARLAACGGKILFGSQKGTSAWFARKLTEHAAAEGLQLRVVDLSAYEVEQLWEEELVIIVISTYEDGTPPENARWLTSHRPTVAPFSNRKACPGCQCSLHHTG